MALTWHPSFKPFIRYTFFSCLPPYYYNHKIGCLKTFEILLFFIRLLPILITEKEFLAEMFFMVTVVAQSFLRSIIFIWKRKSFAKFSHEINKFIQDNKFNPIIQEKDYFLKIWKKNFVFKHTKWYFTLLLVICASWQIPVVYDMATNLKNVIYPYYPIYSPYFEYNSYTKLAYTLTDLILDWNVGFNLIHFEIVSMSFMSFLLCQYLYIKELLDKICIENGNNQEKMKWWIENHCKILRHVKN